MTIGLKTMTPSTGIEHLHCPQCRRNHLIPRQGTVTIQKKKVPAAFAECGFCGLTTTVEERQFTRELFLVDSFFPGDTTIEL